MCASRTSLEENLMKAPRFLLSQNKLAKSADLFIGHTRVPAFLARYLPEETDSELLFAQVKRGGIVELVRQFEEADQETVHTILTHMADWYNYGQKKE